MQQLWIIYVSHGSALM